jgi:uracil-DNA glycosylase, family 4
MNELNDIENEVRECKKCGLWEHRNNYVFGEGDPNAEIVFVGEAPGREEDKRGKPFIGSAGKVLSETLEKAGLKREGVYITNILKCRPPNNRDPLPEEVKSCSPYLIGQIESIRPKVIVCLGKHASSFILELFGLDFSSISRDRGRVYKLSKSSKIEDLRPWGLDLFVVPTYHPAATLYRVQLKESFENDIRKIAEMLTSHGNSRNTTLDQFFDD